MCRASDMLDAPAMQPAWRVQLCLWCMSPAVAFAELHAAASSIVLTSGTLSPLDSIATEVRSELFQSVCGQQVLLITQDFS